MCSPHFQNFSLNVVVENVFTSIHEKLLKQHIFAAASNNCLKFLVKSFFSRHIFFDILSIFLGVCTATAINFDKLLPQKACHQLSCKAGGLRVGELIGHRIKGGFFENRSLTRGHKDYFDDSHESFGAGAVCVWLVFVIGVSISKK